MTFIPPDLPCLGKHELFDATDAASHARARALCLTQCDHIDWCKSRLAVAQKHAISTAEGRPSGTWAGKLLRPTGRPRTNTEQIAS